jgi:hypothetical protein
MEAAVGTAIRGIDDAADCIADADNCADDDCLPVAEVGRVLVGFGDSVRIVEVLSINKFL